MVYHTFDNNLNFIENQRSLLPATNPDDLDELVVMNFKMVQNGFIYIYVNNESRYAINFNNTSLIRSLETQLIV